MNLTVSSCRHLAQTGRTAWSGCRLVSCLLAAAAIPSAQAADESGAPAPPILFGALEDAYPYSFRDDDGQLRGFAKDVANAVAQAMGLRHERVSMPDAQLLDALMSGLIDAVQFWGETSDRRQFVDFSVPVVRFETIAVVRIGETRIRRLADLDGMRVAVGTQGNVADLYLRARHPTAVPIYTATSEEVLLLLSRGGCDAVVMTRISAHARIQRLGLENLRVLEDRTSGSEFDVRYCFAVRKGNALLLSQLNEGLDRIRARGDYDRIYQQWFGDYEKPAISVRELLTSVAIVFGVGGLLATWGFVRQRRLSRRFARQAAELADQRSLLAALHEHHPIATLVLQVEPSGSPRVLSINPEARKLFGLVPSAVGRPIDACGLQPHLLDYLRSAVDRWRAHPHVAPWETRLSPTRQLLETTIVPIDAADSVATRLCVLSEDITARRVGDYEVAQSNRLRALGELVGGIAHEFNNLLTPIIATTSLLRLDHAGHEQTRADLAIIDEAAQRAAKLTRRLLAFGRKADDQVEPVHLAEIAANCLALLRPSTDRRVAWDLLIPPDLPPITFNPTDLNQIVFNLIINARDALQESLTRPTGVNVSAWTPRLTISACELPPTAHQVPPSEGHTLEAWQRLTVADNGPGIPLELQDRIFEPFFTTKEVGKGTGLGLATVWRLATDSGGTVTVESKPAEGARFHVLLPRWTPPPGQYVPAAPTPVAASGAPEGFRVLLVEDEPLVARATIALLERSGHDVTHFPEGAAAWQHLATAHDRHDVLLLDLNLPRMSGVDLVRHIRSTPYAGRIIVMSGRVAEDDLRALEALRIDAVLSKPFTPAELAAALSDVRERK